METPHATDGSDSSWGEGSTLRRGEKSLPSTASLEHLNLAGSGSDPGQAFAAAQEPDEKAETVIRRPDSGSSVRASSSPPMATPVEVAGVLLGSRLSHFHLEELIGGGGMGAVFRARDERLDRIVAIKVIPFVGDDPEMQRRFRNEAQSAARLDHPNIARVFDVGMFDGWRYIVFEHIEGTNIRDLVARDGVLSIDDAVFYTRQIAEALHHASGRGVVHRDVKPSNILVSSDGDTKLVDMGLARSDQLDMSGDMTASGVTLGTFDYISPEQARDPRDADVRSDIYSLGCTLYFMLTGRPPYPGGTMLQKLLNHGNAPPPDPRGFREQVSEDLTAIIHKMLAKSPEARYQKAIDLVADLRELAIREGLPRAQSQGTLAISRDESSIGRLATHLPWLAGVTLLLIGGLVLQIMASLREEAFTIEIPASAVTMRPAADAVQEDLRGASLIAGPGENALRGDQNVAAAALSRVTDDVGDAAAQPPSSVSAGVARRQVTAVGDPVAAAGAASPEKPAELARPPRIEKIVIGQSELSPTALGASTLTEALQLAEEREVNLIEIAVPVLESYPVTIPRGELVIRSSIGGSEIRFNTGQTHPMQRAVMIDVGSHRIDFQNLHFTWNVRSAAIDGGALLALHENKRVRLTGCTISIENLTQRENVFAFQITRSDAEGLSGGQLVPAPLSLRSGPDFVVQLGETDLYPLPDRPTLPQRPARPPLVAIDLKNVAARGEMTLVSLEDAAELHLNWDNGLLAVSRRMLEVAGAKSPLSLTGNQILLKLNRVTAYTGEGLVWTRLGPSGDHPMLIDRDSTQVVYRSSPAAPHIEFTGLKPAFADPEQLVKLRGEDNAYDYDPEDDWPLLALKLESGDQQLFWLSEMTAANRPAWAAERPQWGVHWSNPLDETLPPSRMVPAHFFQDGTVVSGFDRALLPAFLEPQQSPPELPAGSS
jgi:eukaryotic-like serine/threonine-protein kinase